MADNTPDFAPALASLAVQAPVTVTTTGSGIKDVQKDGTTIDSSARSKINLITGAGTTLTVADNSAQDRVDVTVASNIVCVTDQTLNASAALFDFTGLSASYAHLLIVAYLRTDVAFTGDFAFLRFNADSGANYADQGTLGANVTVSTTPRDSQTMGKIGLAVGSTAPANLFATTRIFIPHYANSTNKKSCEYGASYRFGTGTTNMGQLAGGMFWDSTAAISRLTLLPVSGNFVSGSRVSVYALGSS